jgi:putative DNA primase/helicase
VFRDFIGSVWNDDREVIDYVQMLLEYSISGDYSQSIFVVATSPGSSGKSVLMNAMRYVFGDYFATLHKDVIIEGKTASRGAADPNLVALMGKRLAMCKKTASMAKLDESVVKYLTGGSEVTARDLFEKPRTFILMAKIIICTNHPPSFDGSDWSMLRRLIYLIFPNCYVGPDKYDPENRPDHRLADVTLNDRLKTEDVKTEILWWLVQGAVRFFETKKVNGLILHNKPASMVASMDEYITDNNPLQSWLAESCVIDKKNLDLFEPILLLHERYREETGDVRVNISQFGKQLKKLGFSNNDGEKLYISETMQQVRVVQGIKLK